MERQNFLQKSYNIVCRCVYCVKKIYFNFDDIFFRGSDALHMAIEKSNRFYGLHRLTSYKELSVELFKQLKENQEMITKNANNTDSPELYLMPFFNCGLFILLGVMANFPCIDESLIFTYWFLNFYVISLFDATLN